MGCKMGCCCYLLKNEKNFEKICAALMLINIVDIDTFT